MQNIVNELKELYEKAKEYDELKAKIDKIRAIFDTIVPVAPKEVRENNEKLINSCYKNIPNEKPKTSWVNPGWNWHLWTQEELEYLKINGALATSKKFNILPQKCYKKLTRLRQAQGLPTRERAKPTKPTTIWTPEMNEFVMTHTVHESIEKFNICKKQYYDRRYILNKKPSNNLGARWTPEMDTFLMTHEVRDVEEKYGVPRKQCYNRKFALRAPERLITITPNANENLIIKQPKKYTLWTDEMTACLLQNGVKLTSQKFNITYSSASQKLFHLRHKMLNGGNQNGN